MIKQGELVLSNDHCKHPHLNPSLVVFDPQVNFLQPSVHFFGKQHEASK
jgi:hypothetical protein